MDMEQIKRESGRHAELTAGGYTPVTRADLTPPEPIELSKADAAAELSKRRAEDNAPPLETTWQDADPEKPAAFDIDAAAEVLKQSREKYAAENVEPDLEKAEQAARDHIDRDIRGQLTDGEQAARNAQLAEQQTQQRRVVEDYIEKQVASDAAAHANALSAKINDVDVVLRGQLHGIEQRVLELAPQFRNLNREQGEAALARLEQVDPQRAATVRQLATTARQIAAQHEAVQQRRASHEQSSHRSYVSQQHQAFERSIASEAPARREAVSIEMQNILESRGISTEQYAAAINKGGDLGRFLASSEFLGTLYDAAAARVDAKGLKGSINDLKSRNLPPVVNAPGTRSSGNGFSQPVLQGAALVNRIAAMANSGGDRGLKAAAAALAASRRGGR